MLSKRIMFFFVNVIYKMSGHTFPYATAIFKKHFSVFHPGCLLICKHKQDGGTSSMDLVNLHLEPLGSRNHDLVWVAFALVVPNRPTKATARFMIVFFISMIPFVVCFVFGDYRHLVLY